MDKRSTPIDRILEQAEAVLRESHFAPDLPLKRIETLRQRLSGGRFQLSVVGQFKRGKSTFINALLGAPVLPVGVVPVTAIPGFISYSESPFARIELGTPTATELCQSVNPNILREFLARFIAEDRNPRNGLGVRRVDVGFPAKLLASGIVLIDTPGVGSSYGHNTLAAIDALVECDAAIFVVSADPPITETELAYLKSVKRKAARVLFVVNKLDYLGTDDRATILEFLRTVLKEHDLFDQSEIFGISARDALAAKQAGDEKAIAASGIDRLETFLEHDLAREKAALLVEAVRRRADDALAMVNDQTKLRLQALTLPLEELEVRLKTFDRALATIVDQKRAIADLLEGDKRRLRASLEQEIANLRRDVKTLIPPALDGLADASQDDWWQRATAAASRILNTSFEAAKDHLTRRVANELAATAKRHKDRFDPVLDSVREAIAENFDVSVSVIGDDTNFELGEDPYWVTEPVATGLVSNPSRFFDRFVPFRFRQTRLYQRLIRNTDELITRNAENLRWAVLRGIDDTIMRLADQFERYLDETIAVTRSVIGSTLVARHDRTIESEHEIARARGSIRDLNEVRTSLAALGTSRVMPS